MANTREQVLENLLEKRRCTINDLAEAVSINPISVRHHITKLEADGLVDSEEERHGVGRPRRVYYLTEAGLEEFPSRYLRLTGGLIGSIKDSLPKKTVEKLFAGIASEMVADHTAEIDLASLSPNERIQLLRKLLASEGFTAEIKMQEDKVVINESTCPYYHVGQEHPEICTVDGMLISNVLSAPASKTKCVLDGDNHCTYEVDLIAMEQINQMPEL
ncbi:MAG: winged helix-turn-helix transcriptional regulator [Chloroflexi bacterium]|nr:MAG: winged helix-turn-helix transcriptional regulator [Chloroflexota bacterium]MBL1195797.1 winged helix-turn-helix transcriptional regulator [Chloroflexota bacterium]NOH13088.1 winged helix-turn-helix transcriptional regulator [Chloroflexota bacterium]